MSPEEKSFINYYEPDDLILHKGKAPAVMNCRGGVVFDGYS